MRAANAARSAAKPTVFGGSCLLGSTTVLTAPKRHFWSTPNNGHDQTGPVGPLGATNGSRRSRQRHLLLLRMQEPAGRKMLPWAW